MDAQGSSMSPIVELPYPEIPLLQAVIRIQVGEVGVSAWGVLGAPLCAIDSSSP